MIYNARMIHTTLQRIFLPFVLVAIACFGSQANAQAATFMWNPDGAIIFVQWLESAGGALDGQMQFVSTDGTTIPKIRAQTAYFTGNRVKTSVRLDLRQTAFGMRAGLVIFGTLERSILTLNFPDNSGGFGSINLKASSVTEFNKAVSQLRTQIAAEASRARAKQEEADRKTRLERAVRNANEHVQELFEKTSALFSEAESAIDGVSDARMHLEQSLETWKVSVANYEQKAAAWTDCDNVYTIRDAELYRVADAEAYTVSDAQSYAVEASLYPVEQALRQYTQLPDELELSRTDLELALSANPGGQTKAAYSTQQILNIVLKTRASLASLENAKASAIARLKKLKVEVAALKNRAKQAAEKVACP
jgi:hypothetical protein